MLRATKWKLEKAKVKVVFRLQFHATNIPPSGWDKLFICFIPTESGKIIAKTSKANVRNGSCKWADPIYETTRLLQDSRNKQYDDKIYKLLVGMGTSRATVLGEATINLADYADASNPFVVSLPLHGSDHGTVLHVTVQLLTAKTGFREFEQQFDRGLQNSGTSLSSEMPISDDNGNKVNTKTQFESEPTEVISVDETGIHEDFSESYPSSIHGSRDLNGPTRTPSPPTKKPDQSDHQGWSSDYSMDNDLAIAHEENHRLRGSLEMAESSISELKLELSALHTNANEMETETQTIAQHLMTEISSGQTLEREIRVLRSECSKFRDELEQLKEIKSTPKSIEHAGPHQLTLVNGLLVVEDRIRVLQEKIRFGVSESNLSVLHSDLDLILGIVHDLEKGKGFTRGFDMVDPKFSELLRELDDVKNERGNLIRKMNEMECYYETLVQELEENQKRILGEFQSLRYEHSTCVYTISTCKAETEMIRRDTNNQILRFIEERQALGCVNEELTKRVTASEIRVRELEGNRERILGEFKSLKNEHSTCGETISTYKAEMDLIHRDMNNQTLKFAKERHALGSLNEELEKRATNSDARVRELIGEFESLKNEHLTCVDTIKTYETENESIRHDMNDKISKFIEERHDLERANEELEKNRECILGELESLKDEHSKCVDTILTCKSEIEILKTTKRHDLGCVNEELEKRALTAEARVKELEENRDRVLGELENLKNEHSTCVETTLVCKAETELIRNEMNEKISKLTEEVHDLERVKEELEENRDRVLGEFESLKNEHSTCGETIFRCKAEIESIRNEMNEKISRFTEEIHDLERVKEELEENRDRVLEEFESLKNEHSTCGETILRCKAEIESIRDEMNEKISKFTEEKHDLERVNEELEKRVKNAESTLVRARSTYSVVVTQLQKDLDTLASQVSSMFETNQNLIKETFSESSIQYPNTIEHNYEKHEKKDPEGGSESLRMAFMKEQCETTVQELKQQLSVSKQHGDNILFKLQDALDEIESRKKSEASYVKRIEELCFKIVGLEAELQSVRAELECGLLNLECCKEEKEKMVALMEECAAEKMKIAFELSLFQEQLAMKDMSPIGKDGDGAQIIELDKMKGGKSVFSVMSSCSSFQDLQRELVQLHKANEELGEIYPKFMDFSGDGNTLKRVLALEIELAESLTGKNKSSLQFQSSFLKQHSDEEAVFKSFRDINELIKDTLDIKGKYVNMETELKEMHERYSQLSLQFAEVEGERQKLMMTVKNVRSPNGNSR